MIKHQLRVRTAGASLFKQSGLYISIQSCQLRHIYHNKFNLLNKLNRVNFRNILVRGNQFFMLKQL